MIRSATRDLDVGPRTDGEGILDLVGLRDGGVVTRRSGQADAAL